MRISTFLIFICLITLISCKNSESSKYYIIDGEINNYNGKIYLTNAADTKYYPDNFIKDSVKVLNGKFQFRLSKNFNIPFPFHLQTDKLRTNRFILEPQNQKIVIDSLYHNVKPKIICENSTISSEEQIIKEKEKIPFEEFKLEFSKIRDTSFPKDSVEKFAIAARKKLTDKRILILREFTKEFPNSYVGFWDIVVNQMYNGYSEELENAYNNLSSDIRGSVPAKELEVRMLNGKVLQVGKYFPQLRLKNKELVEFVFNPTDNSEASYILVDFWFSNCSPCIAQFPKLKEFHTKYNPDQIKIISISTDITKNVDNWYKVMEDKKVPWINFLDENGTEVSPLGINSFPTNYLLDREGVILKKNISLVDLEVLLEGLN